jgi:hypothetical protein
VRDFPGGPVFTRAMRKLVSAIGCLSAVALLGAPVGVLGAPVALAAAEPTASTGNATAITPTSATLSGTVNPEGQATTFYFEYGTTTSYGSQTAMTAAGAGSADLKVTASASALAPNTTYHYRVVATNDSGTTLGSDVSFKTPKPPAPVVSTGHAKTVTQTSATLTGTVNPEGQATTYVFQYGTSTVYTNQTTAASAGSGTKTVSASAPLGPLTSNTTYHYRLAATSVNGTTYGHDVSFKTARPPAGVTLGASSGTITFGQVTTLSGRVLPPVPSHSTVTLQSGPSAGGPWANAAATTASASGAYSFPGLAPSANSYYRTLSDGATSATVLVSVRFRVGILVSQRHPPRGTNVRFHGLVEPGHNGHRVLVQWLGPRGHWNTIKQSRLRGAGGGRALYSVRVRIERRGRYRVLVPADSTRARGWSVTVRIRPR